MGKGALFFVVAFSAMHDPCGTDTLPEGLNGACTRSSDCEPGLSCVGGVCSPDDAAVGDAGGEGAHDSGAADGSAAD